MIMEQKLKNQILEKKYEIEERIRQLEKKFEADKQRALGEFQGVVDAAKKLLDVPAGQQLVIQDGEVIFVDPEN